MKEALQAMNKSGDNWRELTHCGARMPQKMHHLQAICLVCLLQLTLIHFRGSDGKCCYTQILCTSPYDKTLHYCFDCTPCSYEGFNVNPYNFYCGVKTCNFFGCGCEGDCHPYTPDVWCAQAYPLNLENYHCQVSNITNPFLSLRAAVNQNAFTSYDIVIYENQNKPKLVQQFRNAISKQEFTKIALALYGQYMPPEKLEKEFAKMDTNKNGLLEISEVDPDFQ